MSVEQLFTKLREGSKQRRHLRAAKLFALASLLSAFGALLQLAVGYRILALLYASFTVMWGCLAFAQYTLSRKASGE